MLFKGTNVAEDNLELEGKYFLVKKLINKFMQHGKKTIMEHILLQIRIFMKNT
jgi:ribosomal protein S7